MPQKESKEADFLAPPQSKITEQEHKETRTSGILVLSLIFGLGGGIIGGMFITPWYQQNILGKEKTSGEPATGKQIILDEESAIIAAVDNVNPAVVSIVITKDLPKYEQYDSPFGGFFYQAPTGTSEKQEVGAGSGFIITADGMIVTNKHVVIDKEAEYTVMMKDGKKLTAKVVATDPFNDLAIVKVDAENLPIVQLGDSDKLKLGQRVIAIGNALGEFENTVTTGVVSGIGRTIQAGGLQTQNETLSQVLQTDAAINPGNSGGPLINLEGQVIGVNTAVSSEAQLIGFAIPINQVKKVIDDVKEFGRVRRPFLGVRYTIVTEAVKEQNNLSVDYGAIIVHGNGQTDFGVIPGSPADKSGLKEGDIILEIDAKKVTIDNQLSDLMRQYSPGDKIILKILSGGTERALSITLGEAD